MSKKCRAYSESKIGLAPADNRKAFYAGWEAATALRAAIEQEPVAWMYEWDGKKHLTFTDQRFVEEAHPHFNKSTPLYTTPPQRKPLSSEDIEQCCYEADSVADDHCQTWKWTQAFARAIEAKLKEKNT